MENPGVRVSQSRSGTRRTTDPHTYALDVADVDLEPSDHLQDNHHQSEEYLGITQSKKPKLPWWKTPSPWW